MDYQHVLDLADMAFKFAVVPLVGLLFKFDGRLSKIEGKLEVMLTDKR